MFVGMNEVPCRSSHLEDLIKEQKAVCDEKTNIWLKTNEYKSFHKNGQRYSGKVNKRKVSGYQVTGFRETVSKGFLFYALKDDLYQRKSAKSARKK